MKRENAYHFGRIAFALPEMEAINKAAYWDYQRERVYVRSGKNKIHAPVPATTRHAKTETKRYDRLRSCFALSNLHFK